MSGTVKLTLKFTFGGREVTLVVDVVTVETVVVAVVVVVEGATTTTDVVLLVTVDVELSRTVNGELAADC